MNRTKLQNILKALSPDETKVDFSSFDSELAKLKDKLTQKVVVKTLDDVNVVLERNRKMINFQPLMDAFSELKSKIADQNAELVQNLNDKQVELANLLQDNSLEAKQQIDELNAEIATLSARKVVIPDFNKQIKDTEKNLMKLIGEIRAADDADDKLQYDAIQGQFANFEKEIKKLRLEAQQRGGGSMNRQIFIGGVDPLTRYTDINLKAGSNVTISYANNNTTKKVDITIASSGGGGSVGGVVRSISTTTVSSTIGAASGTDYVVLANGGVQITLPDATANTNLYTIKNIGTSSVLINTTSSQTIDGDLTKIMPVQYTSIDVISDSTNWEIT